MVVVVRPPSRAAPSRRQKPPTRAEVLHHLGARLAAGATDVASGHNAYVASLAEGVGEASAHMRQRQRSFPIRRVKDVAINLVAWARGPHHTLLSRQGAV